MKRITIIIASLLLTVAAFAQDGKQIYEKYSGKDGVTAFYISPTMFNLLKELPDIKLEGNSVNLGSIIETFSGMYILDMGNDSQYATGLSADVKESIDSGKYELLMEGTDNGDNMKIYIVCDGETVTEFMMYREGSSSTSMISIVAEMPLSALQELITEYA